MSNKAEAYVKKAEAITVSDTDTSPEAFEALKTAMLKPTINSELPELEIEAEEAADLPELEQVIGEELEVADELKTEVETEESEVEEDQTTKAKKVDKSLSADEQDAVQKRINKLTVQRKSVEEENRRLKAQLESMKAPSAEVNVPEIIGDDWLIRPDTRQKVTMPKAADYADNAPLYFEHMTQYNNLKSQVVNAVDAYKKQELAKTSEANQLIEEYQSEKIPAALERYKDFYEVVATSTQGEFEKAHPWAVEALMESDYGTDIVYKLNKNPAYLKALIKLKPAAVLKEIGRLEAMEESKVKPRMISSAPKPMPAHLKAGSTGSTVTAKQKSFEQLSMAETKERLRNRR